MARLQPENGRQKDRTKEVYEVGLEFEVWSLVFDLFRSSKV